MRAFAELYAELDASTSTRSKVAALERYLRSAPADDAAWAVYFLAGGRPRRVLAARTLREAACEAAGIPQWLFEESYHAVGDIAETIAHLLPDSDQDDGAGLALWMRERILPLRGLRPDAARAALAGLWRRLGSRERFVMNKLLTGGFRVGVSRQLVIRALARAFGLDEKSVAHRMVGYTDPSLVPQARHFVALIGEPAQGQGEVERAGHPYPFFLASPLQQSPDSLGPREHWIAEWKWDGIRAQLVRRCGGLWLWSRGEELITDRFPELAPAASALPDGVVVDGELLAWDFEGDRPLPFSILQRRIGRRTLTPKLLREAPCRMLAYDLLEMGGEDLRGSAQRERRARLEQLLAKSAAPETGAPASAGSASADAGTRGPGSVAGSSVGSPSGTAALGLSPLLAEPDWQGLHAMRERARALGVEGLMLKRVDARYGVGRTRSQPEGDWWKWKLDPLSVDAVLVYAQAGHGRRASLYTDYSFAVWDRSNDTPRLVPFAKAYSGLSDEEIRKVDATIRRTTIEKFGPVRSVEPTMVFEIGFEAIARSSRHKSGIAVRFPRILRMREDKTVEQADTLADLLAMLGEPPGAGAR